MCYRLLPFIFFLLVNTQAGRAQELSPAHRAVFAELGGCAGYFSVNYQHDIWHTGSRTLTLTTRAGIGSLHLLDFRRRFNPDLFIPLMTGIRIGHIHAFEGAAGVTWNSVVKSNALPEGSLRSTSLNLCGSLGYRWQKPEGGFLFRIAWTPVLEECRRFRNWAGISAGYAF